MTAQARLILEHADTCGVATKKWEDCRCGHFQGFDKPVRGSFHAIGCPCACTCNFGERLAAMVGVTPRPKPFEEIRIYVCRKCGQKYAGPNGLRPCGCEF